MRSRRPRRDRILLPGESEGRRSFLKYGLAGGVLLAVGGGAWLGSRRTQPWPDLGGPFTVLSPEEATVLLAFSERLLPTRPRFPSPRDVDLPRRIDQLLQLMPKEGQREVKQLVGLFENALAGFLLDGQWRTFTGSSPAQQDARIRAWQRSRYRIRRTGFRALKKIAYATYYGAPETWGAIGYPGPPPVGPRVDRSAPPPPPPAPPSEAPPEASAPPAPEVTP